MTGAYWGGYHPNQGGYHSGGSYWGGNHYYPYHSGSSAYYSFSFGAYPYYWPGYAYPYAYYPTYAYAPSAYYSGYAYPGYAYPSYDSGYGYSRPNYAVTGTLLGAGIGAIIGNNVHHQTWQGAAIGAGAGLVLGGLAEFGSRTRQATYAQPAVSYAQPNYIQDAPTVNNAPLAPAAPQVQSRTYRPASTMSGANNLFGR